MRSAPLSSLLMFFFLIAGACLGSGCAKGSVVSGDGDADIDADVDGDSDGDTDGDGPPSCGDGLCGDGESAATCPGDCPADCGDGICTHDETPDTCPGDCPADCGDGVCGEGEGALNCPEDCPASCGDGACTHDETAVTCAEDCPASCGDGACTHDETSELCPSDCSADCGDGLCTADESPETCPGDCAAECGDGLCTHDETPSGCPEDCPASCGDGTCTHDESASLCPEDCNPLCGDGFCTHDEEAGDCPEDCPADCGDGACTHDESAVSCPEDCDPLCGDGACTHDEGPATCPDDCPASCGDGLCTGGESARNCPDDCDPLCGDGACTHAESAITCEDDCPSVCGDGACTHDESAATCPDDCPAICGDGACTHGESAVTCADDCPAVCGDGACTHDESAASCADDCDPVCGDGFCTHGEDVVSCPRDCPSVCGDGRCTHDETAATCERDCPAECGDGECTHDEDAVGCPEDCPAVCGDGACTHDEDWESCEEDCEAPITGYDWEARSFIDLSRDSDATTLSRVTSGSWDDGYVEIPIGFDFPFFGRTYDRVYASTNGLLTFGSGSSTYSNACIPSGGGPNNMIAVFWDDLAMRDRPVDARDSRFRYVVRGSAPNRHLIVQWSDWEFLFDGNYMTFEAILHENGTIQTLYHDITGDGTSSDRPSGSSATFGIENADGSAGAQHSCNRADAVRPGTILTYRPRGDGYSVSRADNLVGELLDIRGTGRDAGMDCDDCLSGNIPIGFNINFFGTSYSQVRASSNGWVGLGTSHGSSYFSNSRIPSSGAPRPMVGCFWDDLYGSGVDSTAQYQTIGPTGDRVFIVQYTNFHFCCSTTDYTVTYQVRFHEATGVVDCVYGPLESNRADTRHLGSSATIGIQNAAGTTAVSFSYNEAVLEPGDRIGFFPRDTSNRQYLAYGADDTFLDISREGFESSAEGDDDYDTVPLGFTFSYYGRDITEVSITTNGHLCLEGRADFSNSSLPNGGEPRGLMGPFWDDLNNPSGSTHQVLYQTTGSPGERVFIAQWQRVPFLSYSDSDLTFQIRLYEGDDTIELAYGGMMPGRADDGRRDRASGSSATVGLQSYDRDEGLMIGYNDPGVVLSGSWFVFSPAAP